MQETENTGVIYMITNTVNNKKYIGKAYSYVKHSKVPLLRYGALGRFKRHCSNALAGNNEIPLLYDEMRHYGNNNFKVETVEVCLKESLKAREEYYIIKHETYKQEKGYNFLIGIQKPKDEQHKKEYEIKKSESNKNRAVGGKLRRADETKDLPPNIYKRDKGYFVQIKIGSTLFNKAFLSSKDTDIQKLEKAQLWLAEIKRNNVEI